MTLPVQITFRDMQPSEAIIARVRREAAKLDRYYGRITSCRVLVAGPHRLHRRNAPFHLLIELGVPGGEIVIKHAPSLRRALACEEGKLVKHLETDISHKDMYVTIRDAFQATRRRLQDHVRKLRGDVKAHSRATSLAPAISLLKC